MSKRTPIVVGNWKLNKTVTEALSLVTDLKNQLGAVRDVEIGVAPVFPALHPVAKRLEDSNVGVAGQNCFWEESGAFTGEVSPAQLADVGCRYVIIGHSERRQYFGETDETVGKKARAAIDAGLIAIICMGEREHERDGGHTFERIDAQLTGALTPLKSEDLERVVLAYEPVWAIGTGRTATPAQAQEVHAHIRTRLRERFGEVADSVRIQYGGSVKPGNAEALLREADIDGGLIGGASLKADDFVAIVKAARLATNA
ncbi:triose-phosphate isomerase [Haliangium ochraceum]|uniref:Triosephosphate isomerase n=1 Tax=Haliangium ochraceum (strain DSM 14365 / JCM 11303 / SMP-2) TaxID=502025 RepID=D0LTS6_HALO1|nr:triose-phosphate isomerase [Haliangium ochraceum]ACY15770.1 triosephosphate isomerase [Haliangium ochraceum DSM 14365]